MEKLATHTVGRRRQRTSVTSLLRRDGETPALLWGYAGRDMVFPQWVLGPYRGMLRLWSIKSGRVFVLQADSSEVQRHPRLPIAVWPVEQFRFFNEWTDAPRYSLNPVATHMEGTESPDFDRPDFAPDVRDLTAFGFDAAQALEETDAATRRNMIHIALSGKATWKDAELPLDWPMALILLPMWRLVSMAYSRLRRGYLDMAWVQAVTALPRGRSFSPWLSF